MKNTELFYVAIQVLAVAVTVAMSLTGMKKSYLANLSMLLGVVTNLGLTLPDGGPELCIGCIVWPMVLLAIASGVRLVRSMVGGDDLNADPSLPKDFPVCPGCEYSLMGLGHSRTCPECGRRFTLDELGSKAKFFKRNQNEREGEWDYWE